MAWIGTLPFKGHLCFDQEDFCASSETSLDLFEYTTSLYKGLKQIVWFSPLTYPIAEGFGKDSGGQTLITDLCQAARAYGNCAFASNGTGGKVGKVQQRKLLCSNGRKYYRRSSDDDEVPSSTTEGTGSEHYRLTTYVADKKNSRGSNNSGKALKRRNSTQRSATNTCPAQIVIRLDHNSVFLVCGLGCNNHKGHPPMGANEITNRKRFLDVETLENVAAMGAANIQPAQAAMFTKSRTGEIFTRGQMAYVQGFTRMSKDFLALEDHSCDSSSQSQSSPSDNMLNYLQNSGASYICLYHNGKLKEVRGNHAKAARMQSNDEDDTVELILKPFHHDNQKCFSDEFPLEMMASCTQ